ncbi:MAG: BC1881 family protein [Eubacterium sp.]|nr:BC1881 family protein [Eubacterium sp.]
MDLKNVSTKELVEELASREAVEKIAVAPYEPCSITVGDQKIYDDGGPVVILRIWD